MFGLFLEPVFRKVCDKLKIDRKSKSYGIFQIIRTAFIVNIGMLIFRADTLEQAVSMFTSIFTKMASSCVKPGASQGFGLDVFDYIIVAVGVLIVFAVSLMTEKGIDVRARIAKLPFAVKFIGFMAAIFIVIIFGAYGDGYGVVDLIYANF